MKIAEMRSRLGEINDELETMNPEELSDEQSARFDELTDEAESYVEKIEKAEAREAKLDEIRRASQSPERVVSGEARTAPNVNTRTGQDPFDVSGMRINSTGSELRARAESAIEQAVGDLSDDQREAATQVLRKVKDPKGVVARRILATGSPAYRSAAQKLMGGHAHLLDADERDAVSRAQSLTDASGGFAIPFTLDPTIIYTGDGAANPFRQVSRVESIVTDTWNGVSSAGVSGGYAAEASEVGDDAATLVQPSVSVHRWDVFVPFSFEIGQDWASLESDVRSMVDWQRTEFDATAFTTGTGTNQPTGIITALDGTASEINGDTAETFAVGDVYKVENTLPPRYRGAESAAFMMNRATINDIRQFASDDGHALLERIGAGKPQELLGYPLLENSAMDDSTTINAAATEDNFIIVLGDWSNYLIVDRVGLNFELVPHLFATGNNRPSGQRGFLAWGRTGADSLNDNAFVTLNIATTV